MTQRIPSSNSKKRTLFLDLGSSTGCIACVQEDTVASMQHIGHRTSDETLLPAIESTMKEAGWHWNDLTHCACVIGPGGFMSLRVGVAFANTLVHQLKIPGTGVHLSDVYAARIDGGETPPTQQSSPTHYPLPTTHYVWLHSTKKTELFIRGFGALQKFWPEPVVIPLSQLSTLQSSARLTTAYIGELLPDHAAVLASMAIEPAPLRPLEEALPAFLANKTYDSRLLEPWYGREG